MNQLHYKHPASCWNEALPLGNGRTGVMLFGGIRKETLCFNDGTLWSGYPKDQNNPRSLQQLDTVRELILQDKIEQAQDIVERDLCGGYSEAYLPLGEAVLRFQNASRKSYERRLDLAAAVHTVTCGSEKRTAFATHAQDAVVYRVETDKPGDFSVSLRSRLRHTEWSAEGMTLLLSGNAPDVSMPSYVGKVPNAVSYQPGLGMAFCLGVRVHSTNGKAEIRDGVLTVRGATDTVLLFDTETGFKAWNEMPENRREIVNRRCLEQLQKIELPYETLLKNHVEDHSALYSRESFSLFDETEQPTDELVKLAQNGQLRKALIELLYNYGKYLTIAASRPGGQPTNLQGIWNRAVRPPWSSNYTVNINTEMNYWGCSAANLGECVEPLVSMVDELMTAGQETARINYGCAGGCCNHNTDLWRKTAPVLGDACYMFQPMCGAWLVNEAYYHVKNGELTEYREQIERAVEASAAFVNDWIFEKDGQLYIAPSTSPEASFCINNTEKSVDYSTAFDLGVARAALLNYLEIRPDTALAKQAKEKLARLPGFRCDRDGLGEWGKERTSAEPGHRHFSPLYAFYPGRLIRYYADAEMSEWVRKLFYSRTENWTQYIGWSAAWAICLAGRLHEKERAEQIIANMLGHSVFINLFDTHPPALFQIDGNYGFVAGIHELLVYEENGVLELLPALPDSWETGEIRNLVINGVQISFRWSNGLVTQLTADKPVAVAGVRLARSCRISPNITVKSEIFTNR